MRKWWVVIFSLVTLQLAGALVAPGLILWPSIFVPLAVLAVVCVAAGALFKVWVGLLVAEIFSVLGLACLYVVGGSLFNDELTVRTFFAKGYLSLAHVSVFASFSALVFTGHFTRRLLSKAPRTS